MDHYHLWFNLKPKVGALEFAEHVDRYLTTLKGEGLIEAFRMERRKLGFGPPTLGEFHVVMRCRDMAQLDSAFRRVAPRRGKIEELHAHVFNAVQDLQTALYRDFPDPELGYEIEGSAADHQGA